MIDYKEFSESELNKLIPIQNDFKAEFKIDNFANWFYDADVEILRLYNDDNDEVFFKYIPIITFSLTSKTWMWSWFNNYLSDKNKIETLKIKKFGEENNYEKLTNGTFPSDEYDGWEFLAIAFEILKAIGTYKINLENLEYYVLITEQVYADGNSEVKKLKQKKLECGNHGYRRPAFVCQHLDSETKRGFVESFEATPDMDLEDDEDFAAWCDECEKIRIKYNGWNEESEKFANIKMICENCYFEMKALNNS